MAGTTDVRFIIAVEDAGAIRKLTETERALYDLQNTTKKTGSAFSELWKGFAVGSLAVSALHKGFSMLKGFIEDGIKGAIEEEQSQHRLTTALEMTGRTRAGTSKDLFAFAQAQMAVTTYTHEEVEGVMALLTQLTKLDSEGIQKATKGAMGLASVLGMDLSSAAMMVTKAMEGNVQALARVGIRIDETLPKNEQLTALMDKLAGLYPRATAELDTMGGSLKQVKVAWGEVLEQLGKNILEDAHAAEVARDLTKILREMGGEASSAAGSVSYLGLKSGITRQAMKQWTGELGPLVQALQNLQAEAPNIPINIQAMTDAYIKGKPAFDAYLEMVRGASALIDKFNASLEKPPSALDALLKELGLKSIPIMKDELDRATKALNLFKAEGGTAPGIIGPLEKKIADLTAQLFGAAEGFDAMTRRMFYMAKQAKLLESVPFTGAAGQRLKEQWNLADYASPGTFDPRLDTAMPESYTQWLDAQKTFAKEATSEVKDFYEGSHDYSAEFYQDITQGFTAAFMKFNLSVAGFKDFFIATWQAIKQAFFQILADMLAKWLTMAFVKLLLNVISPGSFFPATAGSIGMQAGFSGVISRPTPILVGEAGPEYVNVRPLSRPATGPGTGGTTVNITVHTLDAERFDSVVRYRIAPVLKEIYAHGGL